MSQLNLSAVYLTGSRLYSLYCQYIIHSSYNQSEIEPFSWQCLLLYPDFNAPFSIFSQLQRRIRSFMKNIVSKNWQAAKSFTNLPIFFSDILCYLFLSILFTSDIFFSGCLTSNCLTSALFKVIHFCSGCNVENQYQKSRSSSEINFQWKFCWAFSPANSHCC